MRNRRDLRSGMTVRVALLALAGLCLAPIAAAAQALQEPRNVILMIGDGMGPAHVEAARLYQGAPLSFESAPHQALMTTWAIDTQGNPVITDSAASATAMATGQKVRNAAISVAVPGDNSELETSLEIWSDAGKRTGLVTTSYIEDATPAAFGAHNLARFFVDDIADDYLVRSRPNLLLGAVNGTGIGMDPVKAAAAGYTVVETRAELLNLDLDAETHISGQFGLDTTGWEYDYAQGSSNEYDTVPLLSEMTSAALSFMDRDPDGFFLMIEQENTDAAGHLSNADPDKTGRDVFAALELSAAVQTVLDWIALRPDPSDTLLIVTADHETGGLQVLGDNGAGQLPDVSWAGTSHTNTPVGVYAWGPNAELVTGVLDNTDIFRLTTVPEPSTGLLVGMGLLALYTWRRSSESP